MATDLENQISQTKDRLTERINTLSSDLNAVQQKTAILTTLETRPGEQLSATEFRLTTQIDALREDLG